MAIDAASIAQWTEGTWLSAPSNSDLSGVCFDARLVQAGELFIALAGNERDGHDFVGQAHAQGAAAALVERPVASSLPQLLVRDTRQALAKMASAHRQAFPGRLCGITGSCGKTSTKSLLAHLLQEGGAVHATPGNWNNQIGVPITLLGLDPLSDRFSVVEAGINQTGEMASLARMIEGDLTIITTIGAAHLEQLFNLETVAEEKSQLARFARVDSPVFMPASLLDYPAFSNMSSRVWAVYTEMDCRPSNVLGATQVVFEFVDSARTRLRMTDSGSVDTAVSYELATCSQGMLENAALAILAARYMGLQPDSIQAGLLSWQPREYRGQWYRFQANRWYVDCYNANPQSMRDALQFFIAAVPKDVPCTYVLGTLQELGAQGESLHKSLFEGIEFQGEVRFILVGESHLTRAYRDGLLAVGVEQKRIICFRSTEASASTLRSISGNVFLKGSRQHKLETLLSVDAVPEPSFIT
ncbi:MAG: UDP-N-acetylmuramoyl-tripeptide--D-alanyl-D-alanine ligase [Opitutales bacterium]